MNTIWFFGDCFTWGFGCKPKDPYYKFKKEDDKIWTGIVAEKLNMRERKPYYGVGAFPYIIHLFIDSLKDIKSDDIVIFGDTIPDGVLTINKDKNKISSLNCVNFKKDNCYFRDEEEKNVTLPFLNYHTIPHKEKWVEFYKNQVESISKEILKRNVKTFYWSHDIWDKENKFERIIDATNGEIDDVHFSWKGHKEMAQYILKLIEDDNYIGKQSVI